MITRCVLVLILASSFALTLFAQAQEETDARIIEEDAHVTSVEARQRAVASLLSEVDELRKSGQVVEAARTMNRVGRFQIRMSVANDAITTFQESLKLLAQQPDIKTHIDSLNGLASSYDSLSKCELVEPTANEALTLSQQNNYVPGQAEALLILSDCQNIRDHALALKTAQEGLRLWSSTNRKRGMAEAHLNIGHYQMTQNNLVECAQSLNKALGLFQELDDADKQAEVLINLAYIGYRNRDWQNTLAYYIQAQSMIDEKAEPFKMGQITIGLGDVFLESGMPDVALPKYLESLNYFLITKNQRAASILKWSIGKAHYFSGEYQEAIASFQAARAEGESSGDVTLQAFCDDFLGRTYQASNDYAAALNHFQSALEGYTKAKNTMEATRIHALMGSVYQQQGNLNRARTEYQTAIATFHSLSDHINESATLYALGTLEMQENSLDAALNHLQQSIDVTENIRRVSNSSDLTAAFTATVHERYESYIDCMMRKHQAEPQGGFLQKAFEISELGRARSLAELLSATQTNLLPGLDPQLAEAERSLRQSLKVKEDAKVAFLAKPYRKEDLDAIESELSGLETKYKQVNEEIRSRFPAYDQVTRPVSWTLSEIQEQVVADDQTVLLEYSLGKDRSYLWVVTRNHIASYELPPGKRITEAAEKLHRLLSTPSSSQIDAGLTQATQDLSQMILSPATSDLQRQRVIVVADGALHYIPFQILTDAAKGNAPLVANVEVINTASASILGQLRHETAQRQTAPYPVAAFGDPVFASNYAQRKDTNDASQLGQEIATVTTSESERWRHALRDIETEGDSFDRSTIQPLFFATRELANLRTIAGRDALIVTGFDATRENLAHIDLTKYAILHFATHGVLDPKRPENSGLFLSMVARNGKPQDGFVGLQDIYSLHAPVDLVVLSACRTGLGKDVRGEGLIGLTRGFMYAGASSVMASLWKVDDEATSELMKRFYVNLLQKGMTPSAALRAAQNSIRSEPQWRSPYFWAAFTLQGEYRQVINPSGASSFSRAKVLTVSLLGLLLLAGGAWLVWLRRRKSQSGAVTPR